MTVRLYIDIETFSKTDLKKSGVYRYVEDPYVPRTERDPTGRRSRVR